MTPHSTLEALQRSVADLVVSKSAPETMGTLVEGMQATAPRGAVFLVRRGELSGWTSFGYAPEATQQQQSLRVAIGDGWLGELGAGVDPALRPASAAPNFGQAAAHETLGASIGVAGQPIAVLIIERDESESWSPQGLALLLGVVQLRLELDLALRKMSGPEAATGTAAPAATPQPADSLAAQETVSPPLPQTKLEIPLEQMNAAQRYARLLATDIRLYNEEAVILGRRNGDLVERLTDSLRRGCETFLERHEALGETGLQLLHEAYVEVLAAGDTQLLPRSVVDSG